MVHSSAQKIKTKTIVKGMNEKFRKDLETLNILGT